ncbi:DUF2480 family protein [Niabella terrae]
MEPIRNKVAESGIITLDLEKFYPAEAPVVFDIKDYLFMGMILKEKEFRQALKELDWQPYSGKTVIITCGADAIIPLWAYMLITSYLQPLAASVSAGNPEELRRQAVLEAIYAIDPATYSDKRVVIKGCGDIGIGPEAYTAITTVLLPVVRTLMYGEPCSTVPIYKKR